MHSQPQRADARAEFYDRLDRAGMAPVWESLHALVPKTPATPALAAQRDYDSVARHRLTEAGAPISAQKAERRVPILENPVLSGKASIAHTLYAGLQLILPGRSRRPTGTPIRRSGSSLKEAVPTPVGTMRRDFPPRVTGPMEKGAISLAVNGETRQASDLSLLIWSVVEVIADLSTYGELMPGNLIDAGTTDDVGVAQRGDALVGRAIDLARLTLPIAR